MKGISCILLRIASEADLDGSIHRSSSSGNRYSSSGDSCSGGVGGRGSDAFRLRAFASSAVPYIPHAV